MYASTISQVLNAVGDKKQLNSPNVFGPQGPPPLEAQVPSNTTERKNATSKEYLPTSFGDVQHALLPELVIFSVKDW
ncbi:hypothetical protein FRC03_008698 [Tulasnella sp. 419]|nr:hypothetical protein FRC03_008698 [Tulasnella sp. 419]